jgi:hypothetical protein
VSEPCNVCAVKTFPALNSVEHTDWSVVANHAMVELHVCWLRSVLHVAHNIELSTERLFCACLLQRQKRHNNVNSHSVNRRVGGEPTALNACELCSRSEKDRHELNASEFVIFVKKFWQPTVEKLASSGVSKA